MAGTEALTVRSGRVKFASRLATRAFRAEHREFLAEGPQSVREALRAGAVIELFGTEDSLARHDDIAQLATGTPIHRVGDSVVTAMAGTVHPQGIVARCHFVDVRLDDLLVQSSNPQPLQQLDLVVVCADVRDPGNAGTVIRCADAVGAGAVIFTGHSVDPFNPKAVRASAGSIFHLPLVLEADTAAVVARLRETRMQVLAADGRGGRDLFAAEDRLAARTAWLLGNEAWGLPEEIRSLADEVVAVPIFGRAESLNLATAAAVCLYASARAQRGV